MSEPPLPGQDLDPVMTKLLEPMLLKAPKAGNASVKKKGKATAVDTDEEPKAEAFGDDEAAASPEEEEDKAAVTSTQGGNGDDDDDEDDDDHVMMMERRPLDRGGL